jgi:uncharacterized protein (TIGR02300 family)
VSKTEWGMKRLCPSCGMRYYDMKKNPPVCPKCKTTFDPENLLKARRGRNADKKVVKDIADEVVDDLPATDDAAAEDAVIEDAEELSDEVVEEVVEVEEDER